MTEVKKQNKKYYWMRLPKDFFNSKEMKKLRTIAGGEIYTIIYLKMQLLSIDKNAYIEFEGTEETIAEQLSYELDESKENIAMTLSFLLKHNLVEMLHDDIDMLQTKELIGVETESAKRVRKHRNQRQALHCNTDVIDCNEKVTTEIEKEIELEIKKDINTLVDESTCKQSETERIEEMYSEFRKAYPKKQGSKTRVIKYYKLFKDKETTHKLILEDLEKRKGCVEWLKDNGQYIPNFDTYIYNERWLDEYETTITSDGIQKTEGLPDWYLNDEPETKQQNEQTDKDLQEALAMLGGSE